MSLNTYIAHILAERHKLTALEKVAEQWAAACAAAPNVTFLEYKLHDVRQWQYQSADDSCQWHFNTGSAHRGGSEVDTFALVDMVPYLSKPPKVYRAVVKHRKPQAYQV